MTARVAMLEGWAEIAKRVGVSCTDTAVAYARLSVDPLPVVMIRGDARAWPGRLDEWAARRNGGVLRDGTSLERIEGVAAIAEAIGVTSRSVLRLAAHPMDPLPVMGKRRQRWAYTSALRDWSDRHTIPFQAVDRHRAA